ncbi:hypothetical protein [Dyadobacter sp. 3J3]|uniref:hypothetical protein n=1 Tax=Dyadobacter sp. 3J3 TaxID=2606600 RepID=UPI001356D240|nr:hypothetical protein [Dyadobacter sp. 3J3]
MDRRELKELLKPFIAKCADYGKPLSDLSIEEAYPGDNSTSYIIKVMAPWINDMSCFSAIDILFDILWETTDEEIRKKVFSIQVVNDKEELQLNPELMY